MCAIIIAKPSILKKNHYDISLFVLTYPSHHYLIEAITFLDVKYYWQQYHVWDRLSRTAKHSFCTNYIAEDSQLVAHPEVGRKTYYRLA